MTDKLRQKEYNFEVIVDKIYQKKGKSLLKNVNNIYISCPNSTINEPKNYINAPTLINKVHRFRHGVSQQENNMEHAVRCSLIKGSPF